MITEWERPNWYDLAACRGLMHLYYPERTGQGAIDAGKAKKICAGCPVREECLTYALEVPECHGIRGGMAEKERAALRRKLGYRNMRPPTHKRGVAA